MWILPLRSNAPFVFLTRRWVCSVPSAGLSLNRLLDKSAPTPPVFAIGPAIVLAGALTAALASSEREAVLSPFERGSAPATVADFDRLGAYAQGNPGAVIARALYAEQAVIRAATCETD